MILIVALALCSCSTASSVPVWKKAVEGDGPGNPDLLEMEPVEVRNLPKSRSGNRSEYVVFGQRYQVMDSAQGFVEEGPASWYGSKFHGRATASGEIYDMHRLTAAHKHLPLPTFVRVTRLDNARSIIVKVNDRGPFVDDRIIDLSYAAAVQLDILENGKAAVRIEALSTTPDEALVASPSSTELTRYVQLGAFKEADNASQLSREVSRATGLPVLVQFEQMLQLYRVRVGPLFDENSVLAALQALSLSGLQGHAVQQGS
jgi:rare lipoprotein A